MVARHHGVDLGIDRIAHEYAIGPGIEVGTTLLLRIAQENGFKAKRVTLRWDDLAKLDDSFPLIAPLANGNYIILAGFRADPKKDGGGEAMIVDPLAQSHSFIPLPLANLLEQWRGEAIFLKRIHRIADEKQPFGLRWFVPELLKQRRALAHVAIAGLLLHGIGLVTPLFFQVVVDKVLVHNSADTLTILGIGVSIAVAFEAMIGFLRDYLLLHTTNKLDIRLSTRIFNHLLRLPLGFFEASAGGVTVQYMQQIERIREFLTGKLFSTILDSWALLVFLPVLMFYSLFMAGVVLAFSLLVAATVLLVMPYFRRELLSLYRAEGQRQALLVETVHGMPAVKALAIEPSL
jgi:subfamily B ATP-binding cassette protein HlyB/CyaB